MARAYSLGRCAPDGPGGADGAIATGHSVWGMLNAPASGEAMAELILDGVTSQVNVTPFAPDALTSGHERAGSALGWAAPDGI